MRSPDWREIAKDRDARLVFNEESHTYYVDGTRYDSVTQVVGRFFPEFHTYKVAERVVTSRKMTDPSYKYYGMTIEEVIEEWARIRTEASEAGNLLHKSIEAYASGHEIENPPPEYQYFLDMIEEYGFEPVRAEWGIYDEEYEVAGTLDMLFKWRGDFLLFDWKRSKEIETENNWESGLGPFSDLPDTNYWKYTLQLNTYDYILRKHYKIAARAKRIVVLHPDNPTFRLFKVPDMRDRVEKMLQINHEMRNAA